MSILLLVGAPADFPPRPGNWHFGFINPKLRITQAWMAKNSCLTERLVHENTLRMNTIALIAERILPFIVKQFPGVFQRCRKPRRRVEIQLEFHWAEKR